MNILVSPVQYPKDEIMETKQFEDVPLTISIGAPKSEKGTTMTNSVASALDDSTPSDSGVQLMDSMSSDMNESFMSNFGLDYDGNIPTASITAQSTQLDPATRSKPCQMEEFDGTIETILPDVVMATATDSMTQRDKIALEIDEIAMTKSDIDNSNVDSGFQMNEQIGIEDIPDEMKTSTCSTFDTEAIVFRRKVKKSRTSSSSSSSGSVKKRVSFHEDILKNTKTDNIHIEHGFITYKGGYSKKTPYRFLRNSWCSQGQCERDREREREDYAAEAGHTCYRNACSDVLDYGQADVFDRNEIANYDHSGIFEYAAQPNLASPPMQVQSRHIQKALSNEERNFYHCKCSDSSSSLESNDNENGNNCKRNDYGRTKSSSCDCIGQTTAESNKLNNNGSPKMTDNCYFSDPCMDTSTEPEFEPIQPKSVWCKDLKPKSSCLKKIVRDTEVIVEQDTKTKVKKFNVHQLPDVNNLFGSLKNIFSISIPERGVPEGCEDLHNVYECVPEIDSPLKNLSQKVDANLILSPKQEEAQTPTGTIPKSKRKPELSLFPIPMEDEMVHVAIADDTTNINASSSTSLSSSMVRPTTFRNKFIVNCESTVFEHTGVFFETTPQSIPDIPNSSSNCVTPQKPTKSILSFSTAPLKQKISSIFSSFRDNSNTTTSTANHSPKSCSVIETQSLWLERERNEQLQAQLKKLQEEQMTRSWNSSYDYSRNAKNPFDGDCSMTSSIISNSSDKNDSIMSTSTMSTSTNNTSNNDRYNPVFPKLYEPSMSVAPSNSNPNSNPNSQSNSPKKKTRHLASPLRRKAATSQFDRSKLSPDLFCGQRASNQHPMVLLNEEFDDLLTITTDAESNENEIGMEMETEAESETDVDIEIVDYSTAVSEAEAVAAQMKCSTSSKIQLQKDFLRPPSSKSSLINRFLRNVTQKKINDATVKKNIILSTKYKNPPKLFSNLYVKTKKPIISGMMADFNAEIAQEMEANYVNSIENEDEVEVTPRVDATKTEKEFGMGVGEVSIDIFDVSALQILRDETEKLIKVIVATQSRSIFQDFVHLDHSNLKYLQFLF